MGKLNKLMTNDKYLSYKYLSLAVAANKTNEVIFSVSGAGEFYGMYAKIKKATVVVDGVEYSTLGNESNNYVFKAGILWGLTGIPYSSTFNQLWTNAMPFKNSFTLKVDTSDANTVNLIYALYE